MAFALLVISEVLLITIDCNCIQKSFTMDFASRAWFPGQRGTSQSERERAMRDALGEKHSSERLTLKETQEQERRKLKFKLGLRQAPWFRESPRA